MGVNVIFLRRWFPLLWRNRTTRRLFLGINHNKEKQLFTDDIRYLKLFLCLLSVCVCLSVSLSLSLSLSLCIYMYIDANKECTIIFIESAWLSYYLTIGL